MDGAAESAIPDLRMDALRPYISLTIFEVPSDDPARVFSQVVERLKQRSVKSRDGLRVIVAGGIDRSLFDQDDAGWLAAEPYQADAFVVRCQQRPPWTTEDST